MIESGIVFSGVEHDGDIQQSDEEVERVTAIYNELLGRPYTAKDGTTKPLELQDFLFIAPYNAQVRALKRACRQARGLAALINSRGKKPLFASCRCAPVTANTARAACVSSSIVPAS